MLAARPIEARDNSEAYRVAAEREHDRDGGGRRLGCAGRGKTAEGGDHGHLPAHEIGRQSRQAINMIIGPAILDGYVCTHDVAAFIETAVVCVD